VKFETEQRNTTVSEKICFCTCWWRRVTTCHNGQVSLMQTESKLPFWLKIPHVFPQWSRLSRAKALEWSFWLIQTSVAWLRCFRCEQEPKAGLD